MKPFKAYKYYSLEIIGHIKLNNLIFIYDLYTNSAWL